MVRCRLIVHADDLGQSERINQGVVAAHREGILTSASLMANGVAFDSAVAHCRANPSLDVGIHLCLIEEPPLCPHHEVGTLVGADGRMHHDHVAFVRRYLGGKIDLGEVRRELAAQIARVMDTGLSVSHLDSHQHLHMLPAIRSLVADLAREHRIRSIRFPRERWRVYMLRHGWSLRRFAQLIALNGVCSIGRAPHPRLADHFVGFFYGGRLSTGRLKILLRNLPRSGTCELMCHPGVERDSDPPDPDGYRRSAELAALVDPDVASLLDERGIERISYRDLAPRRGSPTS